MKFAQTLTPLRLPRLLAIATLALLGSSAFAQEGFQSLFDGKSLKGWEGQSSLWSVEKGEIVGTTRGITLENNTFLIWQGPDVVNFHLKLKLKLTGDSNTGIMYRAQKIDDIPYALSGNQMDIHPKPEYLGMLYSEKTGRGIVAQRGQKAMVPAELDAKGKAAKAKVTGDLGSKPVFNVNDWNDYEVIAVGKRLVHKINGVVTVDVVDRFPGAATKGMIGLQLHRGPEMFIHVKDIQLKRLKGKAAQDALKAALKQ